jgi:hypothetical protein
MPAMAGESGQTFFGMSTFRQKGHHSPFLAFKNPQNILIQRIFLWKKAGTNNKM